MSKESKLKLGKGLKSIDKIDFKGDYEATTIE